MTIYDDMQAVAGELLTEFSQGVITYIQLTAGTGPADNPGQPTKTPFILDATARNAEFKYVDGTTILSTDIQITSAIRSDVVFKQTGFVEVDGVRLKIVKTFPIPPAGTPVVQLIFARK